MSPRARGRGSLSRRLTATFTALGVIALLVVGVTGYTLTQWRGSADEQERHYLRSLRLLEARALTFEAYKEVPDAVLGSDPDARADYTDRLAGIDAVFDDWAELAEDPAEEREVAEVRAAATALDDSADTVFDLVEQGRTAEARAELERVEEEAFEPFDAVTDAAVASDEAKREEVRAAASEARGTASTTLVVAGLGTVSLLLLIGAFLAGGVFRPVRELHEGLAGLARGRTDVRLPEGPDDEIGTLSRDFNRLAEQLERSAGPGGAPDAPGAPDPGEHDDARLVLARVVDGLAEQVAAVAGDLDEARAAELTARVASTRRAVERLGALTYPVELDLAVVDPVAVLHDVAGRVADELVRRGVGIAIRVEDLPDPLVADRARLRETLSELVRNALDALPERGGSLGLAARPHPDGVALEVTDDGAGFSPADIAWLHDGTDRPDETRGVGLRLATVARLLLPPTPRPTSRSGGRTRRTTP